MYDFLNTISFLRKPIVDSEKNSTVIVAYKGIQCMTEEVAHDGNNLEICHQMSNLIKKWETWHKVDDDDDDYY